MKSSQKFFIFLIALSCVGSAMGYKRTVKNTSDRPVKFRWKLVGPGWTKWQTIQPGESRTKGKQSRGSWYLTDVEALAPRKKKADASWSWEDPLRAHMHYKTGDVIASTMGG